MEKLSNHSLAGTLKPDRRFHLIGIGGSGMYPLAQILHSMGYSMTGSDNNETDTVAAVRKMGINVFMGHNPANIDGADCVIRSAAIADDNPEIAAARERGLPVIERADLLGYVTSKFARSICVSGTHGKTTVSSMLTHIFIAAGEDISAVIGGKLKILDNGSGRVGNGDVMVCEACEYADTFLRLSPYLSVILNIDRDHLEYFGSMENLRLSFTKFCNLTSGIVVVNGNDDNAMLALKNSDFAGKIVTFGLTSDCDYYPANIVRDNATKFEIFCRNTTVASVTLNVPGEHNLLNAVAAAAAAHSAGIVGEKIAAGLATFTGAGRRFELLNSGSSVVVADDYAHHPAEIAATLAAAQTLRERGLYSRIWAVHQPFTYSRTGSMLAEFAESLAIADRVTLTPIMGGREPDDGSVRSEDLARLVPSCDCFPPGTPYEDIAGFVAANAKNGDLVITMGCGDVNKIAHMIVERLEN